MADSTSTMTTQDEAGFIRGIRSKPRPKRSGARDNLKILIPFLPLFFQVRVILQNELVKSRVIIIFVVCLSWSKKKLKFPTSYLSLVLTLLHAWLQAPYHIRARVSRSVVAANQRRYRNVLRLRYWSKQMVSINHDSSNCPLIMF